MDNLKLAKEILYNENQKIVVVSNGKVVYKDNGFGIKPLFSAYKTIRDKLRGSSCADRVIGKAAAWIYKEAEIKELYCDVITTLAKDLLEANDIEVTFIEEVDFVENKDRNGMCPVEAIAKGETDFNRLLKNIESFLIEKNLL